jgi:MOSC domain-containing protein YiiM
LNRCRAGIASGPPEDHPRRAISRSSRAAGRTKGLACLMASVISVNVGKTRDVDWRGKKVTTAIWKTPVAGPVRVGRLGAEGDQQADLLGHGGEQRALFVYQVESYRYWESFLGREDFAMGQFGENLTVSGMADDQVFVGDRYRVGSTVLEVSQPRATCYKVGIRLNDERMPALLVKHRRPGFYFRVIQEGVVSAGDSIEKLADGPGRMSVADIDGLLYTSDHPAEKLDQALRIDALSVGWRKSFEALRDGATKPSAGNVGLSPLGASAAPAWPGCSLMVTAKRHESDDVLSFSLAAEDGLPLPPALPGQYLMIRAKPIANEPPEIRSYSLCGPQGRIAWASNATARSARFCTTPSRWAARSRRPPRGAPSCSASSTRPSSS